MKSIKDFILEAKDNFKPGFYEVGSKFGTGVFAFYNGTWYTIVMDGAQVTTKMIPLKHSDTNAFKKDFGADMLRSLKYLGDTYKDYHFMDKDIDKDLKLSDIDFEHAESDSDKWWDMCSYMDQY